jgi:hypothetical protein
MEDKNTQIDIVETDCLRCEIRQGVCLVQNGRCGKPQGSLPGCLIALDAIDAEINNNNDIPINGKVVFITNRKILNSISGEGKTITVTVTEGKVRVHSK